MPHVQINYKSGHSVTMECDSFSVKTNGLGNRTFEWDNAKPRPLMLGADDVESVWEL